MSYRVSPQAAHDLDEIYLYWAERASADVAERLLTVSRKGFCSLTAIRYQAERAAT